MRYHKFKKGDRVFVNLVHVGKDYGFSGTVQPFTRKTRGWVPVIFDGASDTLCWDSTRVTLLNALERLAAV
jgi:hypothetical protein